MFFVILGLPTEKYGTFGRKLSEGLKVKHSTRSDEHFEHRLFFEKNFSSRILTVRYFDIDKTIHGQVVQKAVHVSKVVKKSIF